MDEKKSGRWLELITIACTGWLLYTSIQFYRKLAEAEAFSAAEWVAYTQTRHVLWVLYSIGLVMSCSRFLLHGFDEKTPGVRLVNAVQSTLFAGVWACLWLVGFADKTDMILWAAMLVFLAGWALWDWRKFRKACRERELSESDLVR